MRLHHLALLARDVGRLAAFYRDLFGLPERQRHHDQAGLRSVWLDLGGAILMVERAPADAEARAPRLGLDGLYLAVDAGGGPEWEARLAAAGAPVESRTASTLYARDPEGNRFGVSCWPHPLAPAE